MRKVLGCKSLTPGDATEDLSKKHGAEIKFWPTLILLGYTLESTKQEMIQTFTPDMAATFGFPRQYRSACERDWGYLSILTRKMWLKQPSINVDELLESLCQYQLLLMECLRRACYVARLKDTLVALHMLARAIITKVHQRSIVEKLQKKEQILWEFELVQTTSTPNQSLHGLASRWEILLFTVWEAEGEVLERVERAEQNYDIDVGHPISTTRQWRWLHLSSFLPPPLSTISPRLNVSLHTSIASWALINTKDSLAISRLLMNPPSPTLPISHTAPSPLIYSSPHIHCIVI
ncbi:hypothetical protein C8F04DRAFT_1359060 [Mycena alexandri]|uniref:Uncharacterized protein n=1 Tax=Mycena alexandri TaxID=1745969 RepID=A0AAD6X1G0_9AGAR|nr:hypothetical protein C8F04DRAFT_1359060 [Mycena alexandri]